MPYSAILAICKIVNCNLFYALIRIIQFRCCFCSCYRCRMHEISHRSAKFYSILAIFIIGGSKNWSNFSITVVFTTHSLSSSLFGFIHRLELIWWAYKQFIGCVYFISFHFNTALRIETVVICRLLCYRMLLWFLLDFTHSRGKHKSNSLCALCCAVLGWVACFWHNKQYYRTLYYKWNMYASENRLSCLANSFFSLLFRRKLVCYFLFLFCTRSVACYQTGSSWPPALHYNLTANFFRSLQYTITHSIFFSVEGREFFVYVCFSIAVVVVVVVNTHIRPIWCALLTMCECVCRGM